MKKVKAKAQAKQSKKKSKKNLFAASGEDTSNLKSDEPSVREGSYTPELENEDDVEVEEDSGDKGFYGEAE